MCISYRRCSDRPGYVEKKPMQKRLFPYRRERPLLL